MNVNIASNTEYFALGLPEEAMDLTVYGVQEIQNFLEANRVKIARDVETTTQFIMLYRDVTDVAEAISIMSQSRDELRKIFAPEEILTMEDLGYWRMIYHTLKPIHCVPSKKKTTNLPFGPHYSVETRGAHSIIRAKGNTFSQTEALFKEAIENSSGF